MPKEQSHLFFSKTIYQDLGENSELKKIIAQYHNLYLFGSLVPDTFAYLFYGDKRRELNQKFKNFHNTKHNSYLPIIELLEGIDLKLYHTGLAFIAGVVSHMIADRVFHPFVYYFSSLDISRHYLLESYLDIYFCQGDLKKNKMVITKIVKELELKDEQLHDLITGLFGLSQIDDMVITRAVNCHVKIQRLFFLPPIRFLLNLLNTIPGFHLKPMISLCYPKVSNISMIFKKYYKFQDPVTGDLVNATLDQLRDLVFMKTSRILLQMEKRIENKEGMIEYFNSLQGENLNTNIYGKDKEDLRFWDTSDRIDTLVYRS